MNLCSEFSANLGEIEAAWDAIYRGSAEQSFCQSPLYAKLAAEFAVRAGAEVKILTEIGRAHV